MSGEKQPLSPCSRNEEQYWHSLWSQKEEEVEEKQVATKEGLPPPPSQDPLEVTRAHTCIYTPLPTTHTHAHTHTQVPKGVQFVDLGHERVAFRLQGADVVDESQEKGKCLVLLIHGETLFCICGSFILFSSAHN